MTTNSSTLNPAQQDAVESIDGPLLIIAGPGAGKTKTLVERIIYLIVKKQVPAENIMVATFTEKAAKELITRVSNRALELGIEINLSEMYIGTLHSIFLRIIEEHRPQTNLLRNYRLLDEFEQKYLIYKSQKLFSAIDGISEIASGYGWEQATNIAELVNKVAEENLEVSRLHASNVQELAILGHAAELYRNLLKGENALDFSTIQSTMWQLITDHPVVLEELRSKIQYLMIDEYQDTNTIQERIVLALAAPANRLCVVGDDDQGLYRFRGATIRNILEFTRKFPLGTCRKIELVTNYRSHPEIIDFYNRWMATIPADGSWFGEDGELFRYPKTIIPRDGHFIDYHSVVKVMGCAGPESWHEEVLRFIQQLKDQGSLSDFNQLAFLFKSVKGDKAIALANYLEAHGIPVFSPRSALFFTRPEIRLVIGALIFMFPDLINQHLKWRDDAELEEWGYYRECENLFTETVRSDMTTHKTLVAWCAKKANSHRALVQNTNYTFTNLLYELLQYPLFSQMVDVKLDSGVQDLRPVYNLALFSQLLTRFEYLHNIIVITKDSLTKDLQSLFNRYLRFLIDGGIAEYEDFDSYAPSGCVSFMTIHQSKGLEFPIVVVDSLNSVPRKQTEAIDALISHFYKAEPDFEPIERIKYFDFWRLFYTAFSRPQNLLVLSGAQNENGRGLSRLPSRYFLPVFQNLPDWTDAGLVPELFHLGSVKPANIKHEYSFTSHILVYETCPLQYKFFRELEFSPVRTNAVLFGTLVHQTIEDVHKAVLAGRSEEVTRLQINTWLHANYASLSKATRTYLASGALAAVEGHVNNYVAHACSDWSSIQESEVSVSLVKPEYILKGTIDLIRGHDGTVEILDFKTEKKPDVNDPDGKIKLVRYQRQLEIYAHIVEQRYGHKVSKMHLYHTGEENGNPYISFPYNQNKIDQTIMALDGIVDRIESKNFDHGHVKKCEKQCGQCDIKPFCWSKN